MTWLARAEKVHNPYWSYLIEHIPHDPLLGGRGSTYTPEAFGLSKDEHGHLQRDHGRATREDLVARFSWAVPSPASLAFIAEHLDGRPVVEMGAGTGYWAWMLDQLGVDVVAYDSHPPDQAENFWHSPRETAEQTYTEQDVADWHERWDPILESQQELVEATKGSDHPFPAIPPPKPPRVGDTYVGQRTVPGARRAIFHTVNQASTEVLTRHSDRVLLLCWPPYGKELAVEALLTYQGDTVVYIGEGMGGCCADDAFFELLDHQFVEDAFLGEHTQWSGIHDYITVYRRKEH